MTATHAAFVAAAREAARRPDGRFGVQSHSAPEIPGTARDHPGFLEAFQELDDELAAQGIDEIVRVRAIGGFALLDHGLRGPDGYTVDVDTLTDTYPGPVRDAIRTVGDRLGLEAAWLNNDAVCDSAELALETLDAVFIARDFGYRNIRVEVADIPTLTRSKAIAVDTDMESGRTRDWGDLLELLYRQNIRSYAEFCAAYPEISEWEFPEAHRSLECWFRTGDRGTPDCDLGFGDWDEYR